LAALLAVAWTTAAALGAGAGGGAAWHVAAIATAAWAAAVAVAPSPFAPRPPAPRPPAPRPPAPRPPAPVGAEPSVDGAARRLGPSVVAGVLLVAVFAGGVIGLAAQARAAAANPVGPWLDAVRR